MGQNMITIHLYDNRKFYLTTHSRYGTLNDVFELFKQRKSMQIIEKSSGKDITAETVFQAIIKHSSPEEINALYNQIRQ